jgi:hypothetical protein
MAATLADHADPAVPPSLLLLLSTLGEAVAVVYKELSRRRALCHPVSVVPRRCGDLQVTAGGLRSLRHLGPALRIQATDTFVEVFQGFTQHALSFLVDCASLILLSRPRGPPRARRVEFNAHGGPLMDAVAVAIRKLVSTGATKGTPSLRKGFGACCPSA